MSKIPFINIPQEELINQFHNSPEKTPDVVLHEILDRILPLLEKATTLQHEQNIALIEKSPELFVEMQNNRLHATVEVFQQSSTTVATLLSQLIHEKESKSEVHDMTIPVHKPSEGRG